MVALAKVLYVLQPLTRAEVMRTIAKNRRDGLRAQKLCINGPEHGAATDGCRCRRCYLVHKHGRVRSAEIYASEQEAASCR